jgi:hypothetical protein
MCLTISRKCFVEQRGGSELRRIACVEQCRAFWNESFQVWACIRLTWREDRQLQMVGAKRAYRCILFHHNRCGDISRPSLGRPAYKSRLLWWVGISSQIGEVVLHDPSVETVALDRQRLRGPRLISSGGAQRGDDSLSLGVFQSQQA